MARLFNKDLIIVLFYFVRARWILVFRKKNLLDRHQAENLAKFTKKLPVQFPAFKDQGTVFSSYPVIDKSIFIKEFQKYNRFGLSHSQAINLGEKCEKGEQLSGISEDLRAGLSSGTSGERGVFLTKEEERSLWAGAILGKGLSGVSFLHVLSFWKSPLRIALFLRANNSLYTELGSRRIQFQFFDLFDFRENLEEQLVDFSPHIIVAPPSFLANLARRMDGERKSRITGNLYQVFSVAEVLEKEEKGSIEKWSGISVEEIYQCTEGFLGITCRQGKLHLNEEFLFIEKQWIDSERFYPVITDFTRNSQAFVRYRLDDICRIDTEPCSCGQVTTRLHSIDGRADQVLFFDSIDSKEPVPVLPDVIRHVMVRTTVPYRDYLIVQKESGLYISFEVDEHDLWMEEKIASGFNDLFINYRIKPVSFYFHAWKNRLPGKKPIRILFENESSNYRGIGIHR